MNASGKDGAGDATARAANGGSWFSRGWLRWLPFATALTVLLIAGLRAEPVPQEFEQQDKLHHLLGLAVFTCALWLAMPRLHVAWLVAIGLVTAALIELGQGMLPLRAASWADMGANALGVLLAVALTRLRWGRAQRDDASAGN